MFQSMQMDQSKINNKDSQEVKNRANKPVIIPENKQREKNNPRRWKRSKKRQQSTII